MYLIVNKRLKVSESQILNHKIIERINVIICVKIKYLLMFHIIRYLYNKIKVFIVMITLFFAKQLVVKNY